MAEVQTVNSVSEPSAPSTDSVHPSASDGPTATSLTTLPKPLSPRKRRRSSKPTSTRETRATPASSNADARALLSPSTSPKALTGAAAIAEEQQRSADETRGQPEPVSPNSAKQALDHLVAASAPQMSKASDARDFSSTPLDSQPSEDASPSHALTETSQASPKSTSGYAAFEPTSTALAVSNGDTVASPGRVEDAFGEDEASPRQTGRDPRSILLLAEDEARSANKSFTYPGPLPGGPHRTASLPQAGYVRENSSSSTKRHKCPYCPTDFTRHHNLKSHLLTHSQEKPFSCDRCDSRFRRLHDLKRHAKLHTGERPHVCPKCDRSFARGDALARHNKGQGGCAGRRESVGSFAGEDRQDDSLRVSDGDSMPGILYTNEASHEPEHMDEDTETPAERALPRIQRHDAPPDPQPPLTDHQHMFHARQPSTYPPVAARPPGSGSLYPPPSMTSPRTGSGTSAAQPSVSHYPPPSVASSTYQAPPSNVFTQGGGMTESPKPLSPGAANTHQLGHSDSSLHRNRSSSLTHHVSQTHYRRPTGSNTSPPMSLPPPHSGGSLSNAPHLPPLHGLTPPEARYTLQSQANAPASLHSTSSSNLPGPPPGVGTASFQTTNVPSAHNSSSSHGTGPAGSLDRNSAYGPPNDRLWAWVDSLAQKVQRLEEEVAVLKGHSDAQSNNR